MSVPMSPDVAPAFDGAPRGLLEVRALIFERAEELGVGPLTETLKWGQPAYLTEASKAGSTIRLGVKDGRPVAYFICHTGLVDAFRAAFPELAYLGNRGIYLDGDCNRAALAICLGWTLTYHRRKTGVAA